MTRKGTNNTEVKDILLEDISICIKHLHFISAPNNTEDAPIRPPIDSELDTVTNETPSFQALIYQLDMIMLHNLNKIDRGYWPFLKTFSHNNVLTYINQLTLVRSPIGRGRAWLHIALNDHLMESYFRLFLEDSRPIRSHYRADAFIRDQERMKLLQTLVSGLDFVNFELNTNCEYLDKRACLSTRYIDDTLKFDIPDRRRGSFQTDRDLESSLSSIVSLPAVLVDRKSPQIRNPSPFLSEDTSGDLELFVTKNTSNKTVENGIDDKCEEASFIGQKGVSRPVISSKRHYFSQERQQSSLSSANPMRKVSSLKEEYEDTGTGLVTHVAKGRKHKRHKKRENSTQHYQETKEQSSWSLEEHGGSVADSSSMADTTSLVSDFADLDLEHGSYNLESTLTARSNFIHKKSTSPILHPENCYQCTEGTAEDLKSGSSPSEMVILVGDNSSGDLHATGAAINIPGSRHTTDISSLEEISLDNVSGKRNNEITLSDTSSYDAIIERPLVSPVLLHQDESSDSSLSHIIERLEANKTASECNEGNISKSPSPILQSVQEVSVEDKPNPRNNTLTSPPDVITGYLSDTESEQHSKESKPTTPCVKPIKLDTSIEQLVEYDQKKPKLDENLTPFSDSKDFEGLLANYLDTATDEHIPSVPVSFAAFYSLDQQEGVRTEKVVGTSLFDPSNQEGIDTILEGSIREGLDEPRNVTPLSFVDLNLGGDDLWEVENEIEARERSKSMFGEDEEFNSVSSLVKRPDREMKPVEEVRISQNNQLMLRVDILISQEERILKVFRAFDSKYLGLFSTIYILLTDRAVYTMVENGTEGTFRKQDAISYPDLDYITIGVNWQLITIYKKNFSSFTCYTGNEQLSKCLLGAIRQGMAAGMYSTLSLNVVDNDQKRTKKLSYLLEMKEHEIRHFSIVTSGPLRGRFTTEDEEKDPEGYDHDVGLSGYLNWKKPRMFISTWSDGYFVLKDSVLCQFNLKTETQPKIALNLSGGSAGCRRLPEEGDRLFLMEVTSRDGTSIKISMRNEKELICWIQGICEEVAGRGIQESKAHSQSLVMNCGLVLTPDLLCLTLEHEESMKKLSLSYVMDLNQIEVEQGKPYCILKFDSIDWLICFSSEYELGRFERCLAIQWENVYKISLTFAEVTDPSVLLRANQLMELMAGAAHRSDSITRNRQQRS